MEYAGTITFLSTKGFGLIFIDDFTQVPYQTRKEIFFHITGVGVTRFEELKVGDRVRFMAKESTKRPGENIAVNVDKK